MAQRSHFRKLLSIRTSADQPIPLSKWKSRTGMTVYLADIDGPIVTGHLCLVTEVSSNDGLPHSLEHLIFMGSQDYPYKGLVDKIATRLLSPGLNATTDNDHTCYTVSTAGTNGFLTLLPILLDHIFFPLLKEEAFITEVYHVNGKGEDGGVLYTEMQQHESCHTNIMAEECARYMYPGSCPYRFNSGGYLSCLRGSTNLDSVKKYHRDYYRPENMTIIITGDVEEDHVLDAIGAFEEKLVPQMKVLPPFVRPFQDPIPPLVRSEKQTVLFPSNCEHLGHVMMAWRGPLAKEHFLANCANTLLEYLVDSRNSPIHRKFIDELGLCSRVSSTILENKVCCLKIMFDNVPVDRLDKVPAILDSELEELVKQRVIDIHRMYRVLLCERIHMATMLETEMDSAIACMCIGDMLFGSNNDDLKMRLNPIKMRQAMKAEPESFWLELIDSWFVKAHRVVIIGKPSKAVMEAWGLEEKQRVLERKSRLGEAKLKQLGDQLSAAIEANEVQPPEDVVNAIPVPDITALNFHRIRSSNNYDRQTSHMFDKFPLTSIICEFQLDDIHTNFVQVSALLDTTALSQRLRLYLPLLSAMLFELPIRRGAGVMPYEMVAAGLNADTLYCEATLGINGEHFKCGLYPQLFVIMINMERKKYDIGVEWLRQLLFCALFSPDRIRTWIEKLQRTISCSKQTGPLVMTTIMSDMLFVPDCNVYASSIFRQQTFLAQLKRRLDSAPEEVISDLETIRKVLLRKENIRIHMAVDVELLASEHKRKPSEPWEKFLQEYTDDGRPFDRSQKRPTWHYIRPLSQLEHRHCIMGVAAEESTCLIHCTNCIRDFNHPHLIALKVFIQYLKQNEGPLWVALRGNGLVYSFSMNVQPEIGLLDFQLQPASDIVTAFKIAKDIILDFCTGRRPLCHCDLENAMTKLMYDMISTEQSSHGASEESLLSYYRKVSPQYNREMLMKVAGTTIPEMMNIALRYIQPLFDIHHCRTVICCHPSKVTKIKDEFRKMGYRYYEVPNSADCFLNNL